MTAQPTFGFSAFQCLVEAISYNVFPEYFQAAGTSLLSGRGFTWHDDQNAPRVAIINQAFARRIFGSPDGALSITGILGMAAYSVSKRKRALGIRIALGAQRKEVLQAALGRAVRLLAFGSAVGLLVGILASRVLAFIV